MAIGLLGLESGIGNRGAGLDDFTLHVPEWMKKFELPFAISLMLSFG